MAGMGSAPPRAEVEAPALAAPRRHRLHVFVIGQVGLFANIDDLQRADTAASGTVRV